jgi:hypothetical protein
MNDEALWTELRRVSDRYRASDADPAPFDKAYADVARCLSVCHRLGIDHPGVDMLSREAFTQAELRDFFTKTWRLATLHAEERRVSRLEARGGVDDDAADLEALRGRITEARAMILEFRWLGEDQKRRHLDALETVFSDLQRARDAFDVALAGVEDPIHARTIEINHRPGPVGALMQRLFGGLGGGRSETPPALRPPETKVLTAPRNDADDAPNG